MIRLMRLIALVAILVASAPAFAQEAPAGEAAEVEKSTHKLNLSVSILDALGGLVSVGAEIAHTGDWSSSFTVGAGPGKTDTRNEAGDFQSDDVLCLVGSGTVRYNVLGDFDHGLYAGLQLLYLWMNREDEANTVRRDYEGLWLGPGIGYKYTFGFDLVLGAEIMAVGRLYQPDGLDDEDVPGLEERTDGPPVFGRLLIAPNLTVGWAF